MYDLFTSSPLPPEGCDRHDPRLLKKSIFTPFARGGQLRLSPTTRWQPNTLGKVRNTPPCLLRAAARPQPPLRPGYRFSPAKLGTCPATPTRGPAPRCRKGRRGAELPPSAPPPPASRWPGRARCVAGVGQRGDQGRGEGKQAGWRRRGPGAGDGRSPGAPPSACLCPGISAVCLGAWVPRCAPPAPSLRSCSGSGRRRAAVATPGCGRRRGSRLRLRETCLCPQACRSPRLPVPNLAPILPSRLAQVLLSNSIPSPLYTSFPYYRDVINNISERGLFQHTGHHWQYKVTLLGLHPFLSFTHCFGAGQAP